MNSRQHLITALRQYAAARGISTSRVSNIVFTDGKVFARLEAGKDITVGRFEAAVRWLSDNWPEGVAWPEGLARPAVTPSTTEAA